MKYKLCWALFFVILTLKASAQIEEQTIEAKRPLLVNFKNHPFLSPELNNQIRKDALYILSSQQDYDLVVIDDNQTEAMADKKKNLSVHIDIEDVDSENFHIEAAIIDLKNNKYVKRVRRRFVAPQKLLTSLQNAVKLLFGLVDKKELKEKTQKINAELPLPSPPPSKTSQINFRERIKNLKKNIGTTFDQIQDDELAQKSEEEEKTSDEDENNDEETESSQETNQVQTALDDPNDQDDIPAIFAPRSAYFLQLGLLSQSFQVNENAGLATEFEITTDVQFFSLEVETFRQPFENSELDLIGSFGVAFPVSKAEFTLNNYMQFSLGASYIFFRKRSFPVGLAAFLKRDNQSFANVPFTGQGIRPSDVSVTWSGVRLTLGAWEKRVAIHLSYETSLQSTANGPDFNNREFSSSRLGLSALLGTDMLLSGSNLALKYNQSEFTSFGTRPVTGNNTTISIHLGYIF